MYDKQTTLAVTEKTANCIHLYHILKLSDFNVPNVFEIIFKLRRFLNL